MYTRLRFPGKAGVEIELRKGGVAAPRFDRGLPSPRINTASSSTEVPIVVALGSRSTS